MPRDRRRRLHEAVRRARVTQADVLHVDADAPGATFVGDLADGSFLPDDAFDCIVLTQTLHLVYDFRAALARSPECLRPAGCCC